MQSIFIIFLALLSTLFGRETVDVPVPQQPRLSEKRIVYEQQHYNWKDGLAIASSSTTFRSMKIDGTDDREIFSGIQPAKIRGIVGFRLDDRLLVIQEPKPWMVFTTTGEDVTEQYDFKKIENDVQRVNRLRSPDGKKIAFATPADFGVDPGSDDQPKTLYIVDAATGKRKEYKDPSFDLGIISVYPGAWSPDSRFLYVLSSIWEGPANLHMWRIDTATGKVYEYKSISGMLALSMHLDPIQGIGLGIQAEPGEGLSDPIHPPSAILRIDLAKDTVETIERVELALLGDVYPVLRGERMIFTEAHDLGLVDGNRQWGEKTIEMRSLSDSSGFIFDRSRDGLFVIDVVDSRTVIYEKRQRIQKGEEEYAYTYHAFDLETRKHAELFRQQGSPIFILGIF